MFIVHHKSVFVSNCSIEKQTKTLLVTTYPRIKISVVLSKIAT